MTFSALTPCIGAPQEQHQSYALQGSGDRASWLVAAAGPEHPADFRARQMRAGPAYRFVFSTAAGINCEAGDDRSPGTPTIGDEGHFQCPCGTDMECAMVNPHVDDPRGEVDTRKFMKAPKGTSCQNSVPWNEAAKNLGRTLVVTGPVVGVTTLAPEKGGHTYINIGRPYPDTSRFTLVIWKDQKPTFRLEQPSQLVGKAVCAVGRISSYRGSPQIVLRSPAEFRVGR